MIPKMQTLGIIKTSQTAKVELPKLLIFILDMNFTFYCIKEPLYNMQIHICILYIYICIYVYIYVYVYIYMYIYIQYTKCSLCYGHSDIAM